MNTPTSSALTQGLHHLGLTVPDLVKTQDFFVRVLGFRLLREVPSYPAAFVSDGQIMLTLWQAQTASPVPFDRKAVIGLHHFALRLADGQNLDEVHARLAAEPEVEIEFASEPLGGGPARHFMCTIVGGLRMEVIAPSG